MSDPDSIDRPEPDADDASAHVPPPSDEPTTDHRLGAEVAALRAQVAAMSETLDQVVPHLVASLKRNQAFDAIVARLDEADRRLAARHEAPIASVLVRTINEVLRMKHLDRETGRDVARGVSSSLRNSGYDLLVPDLGTPFDPTTSEISSTQPDGVVAADAGGLVVTGIANVGLACLGEVIVPAKVTVGPALADPPPHLDLESA